MSRSWIPCTSLVISLFFALGTEVQAVDYFFEDFESVTLGPAVNEAVAGDGWTDTPPSGWTVDDSHVPGVASGDDSRDGRTEWAGWAFTDKEWWWQVDGQRRQEFLRGDNTIAVADPDEWDDQPREVGLYSAYMSTPAFSITDVTTDELFVSFDSSFRPECCDDNPDLFNDQVALILASFDGGPQVEVIRWSSDPASDDFKDDESTNEFIVAAFDVPTGAQSLQLTFGLEHAENDWWWAFDNFRVSDVAVPEPSAWALSAVALAVLLGARRVRRSRSRT